MASPSIVVISRPARLATGMMQDRTATPSTITVQAPHCAIPHPNFVPVKSSCSRKTQSSGVDGSTSMVFSTPFTKSVFAISAPRLSMRAGYCVQSLLATTPRNGRQRSTTVLSAPYAISAGSDRFAIRKCTATVHLHPKAEI